MSKKPYNTTDLVPQIAFEKHVYHRDMFAHYLRWSHILKVAKTDGTICDFGCGKASLLEVLYRNRFPQKKYTGIDIRNVVSKHLKELPWAEIIQDDIINPELGNFDGINADIVTSFEVIEHVGKQNVYKFLKNFKSCGHENSTYYLSTPNYDENVGAAGNHTFDSGDGRGKAVQEFSNNELEKYIVNAGFVIEKAYGTFASIRDYKHLMNEWQTEMFNILSEYYDTNLLSVMMAPMFPKQARNCLWVLKQDIL